MSPVALGRPKQGAPLAQGGSPSRARTTSS